MEFRSLKYNPVKTSHFVNCFTTIVIPGGFLGFLPSTVLQYFPIENVRIVVNSHNDQNPAKNQVTFVFFLVMFYRFYHGKLPKKTIVY